MRFRLYEDNRIKSNRSFFPASNTDIEDELISAADEKTISAQKINSKSDGRRPASPSLVCELKWAVLDTKYFPLFGFQTTAKNTVNYDYAVETTGNFYDYDEYAQKFKAPPGTLCPAKNMYDAVFTIDESLFGCEHPLSYEMVGVRSGGEISLQEINIYEISNNRDSLLFSQSINDIIFTIPKKDPWLKPDFLQVMQNFLNEYFKELHNIGTQVLNKRYGTNYSFKPSAIMYGEDSDI